MFHAQVPMTPSATLFRKNLVRVASAAFLAFCGASTLLAHTADVSVSVSGRPDPVAVRDVLTYSINVSNSGPDDALGVIVQDVVSDQFAILEFSSEGGLRCSKSGTKITCTADTLSPGIPAARITIRGTAPSVPRTLRNDVSIQAIASIDPNPTNNSNFVNVQVIAATSCSDQAPELLLPSQNGTNVLSPVQFTWSSVPGAKSYNLLLSTDGGSLQQILQTSQTSALLDVNGTDVAWAVEAVSDGCATTRSAIHHFSLFRPSMITVTTLAGQAGERGSNDGLRELARFGEPRGIAVDSAGTVFVADRFNHTIRRIDRSGMVTTFAGKAGVSGTENGTLQQATFNLPAALAFGPSGDLFVAESGGNVVRRITSSGTVSTYAGVAGPPGFADGPSSSARFSSPSGIAVDPRDGAVLVADTGNQIIRRITSDGIVSTFAGSPGLSGSSDGEGAAARFNNPAGLAFDSAANLYVADSGNNTIRRIDTQKSVATVAGVAGTPGFLDGSAASARFNAPTAVAVDGAGNVFVADMGNHAIREIVAGQVVSIVAGKAGVPGWLDGSGSDAQFNLPAGIAIDAHGVVFISDSANFTVRFSGTIAVGRRRPVTR